MSLIQFYEGKDIDVSTDLVNIVMKDWQDLSKQEAAASQGRR